MRWKKLKIVRVVENPWNSFARWNIYEEKFQHVSFPFFLKHHQIRSGWDESPRVAWHGLRFQNSWRLPLDRSSCKTFLMSLKKYLLETVWCLSIKTDFFPNTMRKAANILTEIYLHIAWDGMFSYFIFNLQRKEYWRAKRVLFPRVFSRWQSSNLVMWTVTIIKERS